ncbi:hypothetical protein BN990_01803 [Virgibacillus salexigens]|uniref:Uncharacterized protein n=1 Tax=Virgibacillus massiliensis TaxID=1462526 RepID=A0A024QAG6_9BACI|nr:hypothetical protein BN990_01803 [Virgibacillus massiliensis]
MNVKRTFGGNLERQQIKALGILIKAAKGEDMNAKN